MLIDCDTCTLRGQGCDDCVVTVLLGAPPGWRGSDPTVVPLTRRPTREEPGVHREAMAEGAGASRACGHDAQAGGDTPERKREASDLRPIDSPAGEGRTVVELDEVERRAVRALADFGLVPPLRHQDASSSGDRHVS